MLVQLEWLKTLKEFRFRAVDHHMGREETQWMLQHWPSQEKVVGLRVSSKYGDQDEKKKWDDLADEIMGWRRCLKALR